MAFSMCCRGNPISIICETSGDGGGSSGASLAFALDGGVALPTVDWAGELYDGV